MPKTDFKFHTEFRVRWMECDAQGIVFNGAYLGYLELSTAEYWRNLGIGIYHLPRSGFFDLAVVKTTIEFRAPALVDEMVQPTSLSRESATPAWICGWSCTGPNRKSC